MENKKYLYCPKCKNYPDKIIERYLEPIEETRIYDGLDYELDDSNFGNVEYKQLCAECGTELENKPQNQDENTQYLLREEKIIATYQDKKEAEADMENNKIWYPENNYKVIKQK